MWMNRNLMWMNHVPHMNASSHTYKWVISHILHVCLNWFPNLYEFCPKHKSIMSHVWMNCVPHINDLCFAYDESWFIIHYMCNPFHLYAYINFSYKCCTYNESRFMIHYMWNTIHLCAYINISYKCFKYNGSRFMIHYMWNTIHLNAYKRLACHIQWIMSHIWVWLSHIPHMNQPCPKYEEFMSHIWMNHVPHMKDPCPTYERVVSHIYE